MCQNPSYQSQARRSVWFDPSLHSCNNSNLLPQGQLDRWEGACHINQDAKCYSKLVLQHCMRSAIQCKIWHLIPHIILRMQRQMDQKSSEVLNKSMEIWYNIWSSNESASRVSDKLVKYLTEPSIKYHLDLTKVAEVPLL